MSMKFDKQKHYTQLHLSNEKKWFSVQSSVDLSNVCVKKKTSRVTFVVDPSGHPLLFFKSIKLDFSIRIIQRLLSYPHSMVLRYGVLLGAFEESTPCSESMTQASADSLSLSEGWTWISAL